MSTDVLHLQSSIIYGPIRSRRLGNSLGINLSPKEIKLCSLNCSYCQYSWTGILVRDAKQFQKFLPSKDEVMEALKDVVKRLLEEKKAIDYITFSGNGEPTLHPDFLKIVEETIKVRDNSFKDAKIACLSNSTTLENGEVLLALKLIDEPIMKFDTAIEETFKKLNKPAVGLKFEKIVENLQKLKGKLYIQTLLVEGSVDNTTHKEITSYIDSIKKLEPKAIQIYSLDRIPADFKLKKVSKEKLLKIKKIIEREANINVFVY